MHWISKIFLFCFLFTGYSYAKPGISHPEESVSDTQEEVQDINNWFLLFFPYNTQSVYKVSAFHEKQDELIVHIPLNEEHSSFEEIQPACKSIKISGYLNFRNNYHNILFKKRFTIGDETSLGLKYWIDRSGLFVPNSIQNLFHGMAGGDGPIIPFPAPMISAKKRRSSFNFEIDTPLTVEDCGKKGKKPCGYIYKLDDHGQNLSLIGAETIRRKGLSKDFKNHEDLYFKLNPFTSPLFESCSEEHAQQEQKEDSPETYHNGKAQ